MSGGDQEEKKPSYILFSVFTPDLFPRVDHSNLI